jgi:transcription antitermination factor NusG
MTFSEPGTHWYALQVRPNYEIAVSTRLRELGVKEYLPIHKASRSAQRNKFNEGPPLFPGYIFSFLNLRAGPKLYSVPGIIRVLGYGGQAMPIEDHEIAMVRSIADSPLAVEPVSYLHLGDKICLMAGPLKGVSGTFLSSTKQNKLVVSLPLLRRSLAVTVLSEWVVPESQNLKPTGIGIA